MTKAKEYSVIFAIGGIIYSLIEITFRGYTHWSMTILGGFVLAIMYHHFTNHPDESLFRKCVFGGITITSLEFAVGCIVNIWLDWHVWDYSDMWMNVFGQVCFVFSAVWFFITIPAVYICRFLNSKIAPIFYKEVTNV